MTQGTGKICQEGCLAGDGRGMLRNPVFSSSVPRPSPGISLPFSCPCCWPNPTSSHPSATAAADVQAKAAQAGVTKRPSRGCMG